MNKFSIFTTSIFIFFAHFATAQDVQILDFSLNNFGQVELEIEGRADQYYLLHTVHEPYLDYESITSLTMGVDGTMIVSEPLNAFPQQNYRITAHSIASPDDSDGDGIDDLEEYGRMPFLGTFNYAEEIPFEDGALSVPSHDVFSQLAVVTDDVPWAPFLNDQEFVKFAIVNQNTDNPEVYFINSNTHFIHAYFLETIDVDQFGDDVVTGEIVYNPNEILSNGAIGSYSFNYSFGDATLFSITQKTFELLAANMPFLDNNLQHFIGGQSEGTFENIYKDDYVGSRVPVVLESEVFADVDFLPFHQAEGFGFFRLMGLDDNPGSRDIVLYETLPNTLPRVGGIITSVVQTPLSHVNLRAIQDNLPNAYIKEPLLIDSIANLLDKYIYYKVEQDSYTIREATLEEVNAWYENIRPTEEQIPERDLSITNIMPLDSIEFAMSTSFGAKCTNVATMRKFGFPEGTIPDGFGIPFYFYDEFMKFNGFYEKADEMLNDPEFIADLQVRLDMLKDFRSDIKDADMPQWMLDELQVMHDAFPEGTPVRVRSSTNNEDLPGFSGAGLYTSKTQYPDEGHMSKSVKQVYASMWNFRAYDERDFYRVDHYIAAMGLLCHPNYQEEKSNGVGISLDPLYMTEGNFYLNTQVGEFLITNPDANSIPEEILLSQDPDEGYFVVRNSNLVPIGELVMSDDYLNLMREYLQVIHDEFAILYNTVGAEGFGMDIEYKVTADDRLIIKQARPWVSFWSGINSTFDLAVEEISEPRTSSSLTDSELVTVLVKNEGLREMKDFEISLLLENQVVETITIGDELASLTSQEYQFTIPQDFSEYRDYSVGAFVSHPMDGYDRNDTIITNISRLYELEAAIEVSEGLGSCGQEIAVVASITNLGESSITTSRIEVIANGEVADVIDHVATIPSMARINVPIQITTNVMAVGNSITLNLVGINGTPDAVADNNQSSILVDVSTTNDFILLVIDADDYPEETSWVLTENETNTIISTGQLEEDTEFYTGEVCVDYESCYTLNVFDTYGDGICCSWGIGEFYLLDIQGDTLAYNGGVFGDVTEEEFCLEIISSTIENRLEEITLSPNPTDGSFIIEGEVSISTTEDIRIEVYDNLGRRIQKHRAPSQGNQLKIELTLDEENAGIYFVKCYLGSEERVFKLIKI